MPVILSGRAWKARHIRNNCLRQHCHAAGRSLRRRDLGDLRMVCARVFAVLETRSQVLFDLHPTELAVVPAVIRLGAYAGLWVRQPEDWWPDPAHDARRQWSHLLRHLLARYPVPEFLDSAWLVNGRMMKHFERDCWAAIARGRSLREVDDFPESISGRVVHMALTAGEGTSFATAVWHTQLRLLGAAPGLHHAVMNSRVPEELESHRLWLRLAAKFAAADEDMAVHFAVVADAVGAAEAHQGRQQVDQLMRLPLAELIRHSVKFVAALLQANGHLLTEEQASQAAAKSRLTRQAMTRWQPMLGGESFESGNGRSGGRVTWRVDELCSVEALQAEGKAMRHCVAGYVRRCKQGSSAIFSLRHLKTGAEDGLVQAQSLATIEVHPNTRRIVQIRAYANRPVNNTLMRIVREWALASNLD